MRAADPSATYDHVFEEDKGLPVEQQTVFPILNISAQERAFLLNIRGSLGSATLYAIHLGVDKPKNFFDAKGNPIRWERDEKQPPIVGNKRPWKEECLNYLLPSVADELAALVFKGVDNEVKGAAAKNS